MNIPAPDIIVGQLTLADKVYSAETLSSTLGAVTDEIVDVFSYSFNSITVPTSTTPAFDLTDHAINIASIDSSVISATIHLPLTIEQNHSRHFFMNLTIDADMSSSSLSFIDLATNNPISVDFGKTSLDTIGKGKNFVEFVEVAENRWLVNIRHEDHVMEQVPNQQALTQAVHYLWKSSGGLIQD